MELSDFKSAIKGVEHGTRVTCKIMGTIIENAKLSFNSNGNIYICQNIKDGATAENLLGYNYSWLIASESDASSISDFKIISKDLNNLLEGDIIYDNSGGEKKVLYSFPTKKGLYMLSFYNVFDEADSTYTTNELEALGFKIKETQKEIPEYTVKELIEKLGYNFKIKK